MCLCRRFFETFAAVPATIAEPCLLVKLQNYRCIAYEFLESIASILASIYEYTIDHLHDNEDNFPDFTAVTNRFIESIRDAPPRHERKIAHPATFQGILFISPPVRWPSMEELTVGC